MSREPIVVIVLKDGGFKEVAIDRPATIAVADYDCAPLDRVFYMSNEPDPDRVRTILSIVSAYGTD